MSRAEPVLLDGISPVDSVVVHVLGEGQCCPAGSQQSSSLVSVVQSRASAQPVVLSTAVDVVATQISKTSYISCVVFSELTTSPFTCQALGKTQRSTFYFHCISSQISAVLCLLGCTCVSDKHKIEMLTK